ncbi:hypothetical protein [Actinokineospora sp. HUAS TT18]|uniref:hypothetical protein n=1 Tax=Actinokineospora sp. HUAS TT18 TaxID=3447451 RepID=UPI003F5272C0
MAELIGCADHDLAALAADEHLRFEWYRDARPADERVFLEYVLRDPDEAMAVAAVVSRIEEKARSAPDYCEWAESVAPAVARVDFVRERLAEWRLLRDVFAGKPVDPEAVLSASDWAQRKLATIVDGELLVLLAEHGRTRRVRALTRVPRPARPRDSAHFPRLPRHY